MKLPRGLVPLLSAALIVSCSFEYDTIALSEEEKAAIPDVRLEYLREYIFEDGEPLIELSAAELSTFADSQLQEMSGLEFQQFDADGSLYVRGRANSASRDLANDDLVLNGNVLIELVAENSRIEGEVFYYSPRQDLIWSPEDQQVRVTRENGSIINGRGFIVDLVISEIRFSRGADGVFVESSD